MAQVLVVANQTAESDELLAAMRERAERGDYEFTVLIPATPHGVAWAANMASDKGRAEAEAHRDALVERLRSAGLPVKEAIVGDPDPLAAITDACNAGGGYDELIVSTLPHHVSKWLHLDLQRKAAHATGLPVTSVEAKAA
jgi:alkanesulfonate monooxygenase SsuD/methylene tetrahydromethanopterin reductase-like flavin-dependent oxidoreductase (luciferase family)